MRVATRKTIDMEVEVDVDIADVLASCAETQREATGDRWQRWGSRLDLLLRILAATTDEFITATPSDVRLEVHRRLTVEAARWLVETEAVP